MRLLIVSLAGAALAASALAASAVAAPAVAPMPPPTPAAASPVPATESPALPAASAAPSAPQPAAGRCTPREAVLGGIGHATVVAFRGPVFGGDVCAVVANLAYDGFGAAITQAAPDNALVVASLGGAGTIAVPIDGITVPDAGPYVVAPGGVIPGFGGDTSEVPRVLVAFSGLRVLIIGTSPVALVDLARELRTQPEVFGADAVERAVVIASGTGASVMVRTADGTFGTAPVSSRVLAVMKRG